MEWLPEWTDRFSTAECFFELTVHEAQITAFRVHENVQKTCMHIEIEKGMLQLQDLSLVFTSDPACVYIEVW